jgi:hypothetical protein
LDAQKQQRLQRSATAELQGKLRDNPKVKAGDHNRENGTERVDFAANNCLLCGPTSGVT